MVSEGVACLKSGELSSLSSEGKETEGEGGITVTFKLEPPSEGASSGAASVVDERSRAGITRIWAERPFLCMDALRECVCLGEVSPEDGFALLPALEKPAGTPGKNCTAKRKQIDGRSKMSKRHCAG